MPILAPEYKGFLYFNYDNEQIRRDCYIKIQQTYLSVVVKLKTDGSFSKSKFAIVSNIDRVPFLIYIYDNAPRGEIQNRSSIHLGTAMLRIRDGHLEGNYYTGRDTRGFIQVSAVKH